MHLPHPPFTKKGSGKVLFRDIEYTGSREEEELLQMGKKDRERGRILSLLE